MHYFFEIASGIALSSSAILDPVRPKVTAKHTFFLFNRNFLVCVVCNKKVTLPGPQFLFTEIEQDELRLGPGF